MKEPIFKASHIVKQFGPTIALNDVDIAIYPGEIRGFIGENGSGKSTMSAIMTGIYEATSGQMEYHGKEWKPSSMVEALNGGIGIIVQENGTIGNISVAENIYLGELSNFSGENYFESKKVENFSPLFDLSLKEFDDLYNQYNEKLNSIENKAEKKKLIKEMLASLKAKYLELNDTLVKGNPDKIAKEDERFDKKATESFTSFQSKIDLINVKYDENKENLDATLVSRRREYAIKKAKQEYKAAVKKNDDESYLRRLWIKNDVTYLKNHYLNKGFTAD